MTWRGRGILTTRLGSKTRPITTNRDTRTKQNEHDSASERDLPT